MERMRSREKAAIVFVLVGSATAPLVWEDVLCFVYGGAAKAATGKLWAPRQRCLGCEAASQLLCASLSGYNAAVNTTTSLPFQHHTRR